jgi:hypothetical protein
MVSKKKDREMDERLDALGRGLVRASAANEEEADAVASSPFLYTRLRARINVERERLDGAAESWLAMLLGFWRAIPAMALVAIFAFSLFWSMNPGTQTTASLTDDALLGAPDTEIERVVFADRQQSLSSDEVLATILSEEEREVNR